MFEDPSNQNRQPAKLVLPATPTESYGAPEYLRPAERPFQAGRLVHATNRPVGSPYSKIARLWRKDPAYKVLFIAIGVVLVSSIVCIALFSGFMAELSPSPAPVTTVPSGPQPTPTAALPTPQATARPTTIPTPMPTPTVVVTPASIATAPVIVQPAQPTPNPDQRLTVQIGTLPAQINNNMVVPVTVTTNQPGATVSLVVTYSAIPILYTSNPQTTDINGNTTFSWSVHERTFSPFTRMIAANITAVVHYQDRPQATSQTVKVHILTK